MAQQQARIFKKREHTIPEASQLCLDPFGEYHRKTE
jgi:hypothetical protein